MKRQITQIFHNMIERERRSGGQGAQEAKSADAPQDGDAGELFIGRDAFAGAPSCDGFEAVLDRNRFVRTVDGMIAKEQREGCMLVCDLDRFQDINDMYGRDTGDAVLRNTVNVLCDCLDRCACIGRQGDDTFALWFPGVPRESAGDLLRQVGVVNDRLLHPAGELPPVSVSAGAAFREPGDDCHELGRKAHKMLYKVKGSGRCGCEIYRNK